MMDLAKKQLTGCTCRLLVSNNTAPKDNGTKNFYWPDLSGSPMEYLISYFYLSMAYSCEEISK